MRTISEGKIEYRNRLLASTSEPELLSAVAELSDDLKAGSGWARQVLALLSDHQFASVKTAAADALRQVS